VNGGEGSKSGKLTRPVAVQQKVVESGEKEKANLENIEVILSEEEDEEVF
jgi:hypothetical protein